MKHAGSREAAAEPIPHIRRLTEVRQSKFGMTCREGEGDCGKGS